MVFARVALEALRIAREGDCVMASKLFGGMNLSDVAKQIKEKGDPSPYEKSPARPRVPAAELALTGRTLPMAERTNILSVDPKRCRPWKYHNRSNAWYTKERCQDLIDSMVKDGQLEPALARKLNGIADFDFELIYGMRRRFAAEFTHTKLKVRLTDADDAKAAVLMHIETRTGGTLPRWSGRCRFSSSSRRRSSRARMPWRKPSGYPRRRCPSF